MYPEAGSPIAADSNTCLDKWPPIRGGQIGYRRALEESTSKQQNGTRVEEKWSEMDEAGGLAFLKGPNRPSTSNKDAEILKHTVGSPDKTVRGEEASCPEVASKRVLQIYVQKWFEAREITRSDRPCPANQRASFIVK
ncbi:uncharacterized protein N7477_002162 [Penicillium maclennaniae]|uniref:uncharacterized protein n=1 Tax=Penicillium maclennaniae TaxID=1343394 RepID=UPI002541F795|nr:uncharacterized protein N7477_002162 [Penicillium maclennaniae]KAJ5676529.1 hypothetical protein N7477_002162 [Penicillium maclennaniae]